MDFFHHYHRQRLNFPSNLSIYLSPMSVTFCSDRCYHQKFNPEPSYFHHLAGGRVKEVHEEASPNENEKRTTIHHQSLVPRGGLARGSVPQMLRYIYAPPQNRPRSGDAKQILPLTGDAASLGRVPMPEWYLIPWLGEGFVVLSLECVHWNTGTVTPHRRQLCILHAEHPWLAPHPKKDA